MEIIVELQKNRYSFSTLDTKQFKRLITQYGFLDERGCAICQVVYFENTILLRPLIKEQFTFLENMFLISELTLCPQYIKKMIIESCNLLTQSVNLVRSEIIGHTASVFTQWNQNYIFDSFPILHEPERFISDAQNRFYPQNQHRSASFASTSVNGSTNYLASFNDGLNSFNYANRMAEMETCFTSEDIPPYHTFGSTAVTSSPQKQNNTSRPTINPIPFPPFPLFTSTFWDHIENNVLSPLVTDNFRFATRNAEETYMKFGESHTYKYAAHDEVTPSHRMAYTKNFHPEAPENPSPSTTSSSSSISSNGVLSETGNDLRGKKILGQGIYKK